MRWKYSFLYGKSNEMVYFLRKCPQGCGKLLVVFFWRDIWYNFKIHTIKAPFISSSSLLTSRWCFVFNNHGPASFTWDRILIPAVQVCVPVSAFWFGSRGGVCSDWTLGSAYSTDAKWFNFLHFRHDFCQVGHVVRLFSRDFVEVSVSWWDVVWTTFQLWSKWLGNFVWSMLSSDIIDVTR